ncbi:HNH endonuclease [Demequina sp. NBRC 110055]|uniref:HNH endonuclease n=1 Tax=Demequina sp. NBRC 110055 TaxID=1570344 RepID=UPI0009FF41DB|nr:HNH endonuclease [Demequina sp. NBRC 110055]
MSNDRKDLKTARWQRQRKRVLARDGYQCTACGATEADDVLTVDHIHAVANGGEAEAQDHELATLCNTCNGRKSDRQSIRLDYRAPGWFE